MTHSTALVHPDPTKPDERLVLEAAGHLSRSGPLGLMCELYARLREMQLPWWTAEQLREAYPASERLAWFQQRPDLRQRITTELTGLAPRAARNKSVEFQASLIDSVVDEGDISVETFESAFEPNELVVYGPADDIWGLFRQRMPWDDDSTPHQDLVGFLLNALVSDKNSLDGTSRTPILTPLAVRMAIDGRVWHTRIPLDVRVAIDDARFARERDRPHEAYSVAQDLLVATPALIAASIPLRELLGVFDLAGSAMGFDGTHRRRETRSRSAATAGVAEPKTDPPGRPPPEESVSSAIEAPHDEVSEGEPTHRLRDVPEPPPTRAAPLETEHLRRPRDELEETNPWIVPASLTEALTDPAKKDERRKKR